MSQTLAMNTKEDSQKSILVRAFQHYTQITSRVLLATAGTIAVLGLPAYFLDQWLGTWPWFFVAALVLAFPLAPYFTYRLMKTYLKNNPPA